MTCIKKWILSEPLVDPIESNDILTTSKKFYDIDLEKVFFCLIKGHKGGLRIQQ